MSLGGLQVVEPDLADFWRRVTEGESLTLIEQEELLGVAADMLARVLVLEERAGEAPDRRRAA